MLIRRLLLATVAMAFASSSAWAQAKHISIVTFGEHPVQIEAAEGFKARMTELGYAEGTDVIYDFQHANFDRSLIPQVLQQVQAKKPDLILALTTAINQGAVRGISDKSIPVVFAAIVDPVIAGVVPDWEHGSEWSTGATMLPDFNESMEFVKTVVPGMTRIGTIFNPGEDNDITNVELMTEAAAAANLELVTVPVDNANDLPQRMQAFAGKVDAIFLIQSNIAQTSVPVIAQTAQRIQIPLFNSVYSEELKNELAGFHAISYARNGAHAADIADRVLKGEKPADIPPYKPVPEDFDKYVSAKGLEAVGLTIPEALQDSPWVIK